MFIWAVELACSLYCVGSHPVRMQPQAMLLQRWQELSHEMATRRLSRRAVVALNRTLDEAENWLGSGTLQTGLCEEYDFGLGITIDQNKDDWIVLENSSTQSSMKANAPGNGELLLYAEPTREMHPILQQVTHLVKELRQRQKEFRVSWTRKGASFVNRRI